MWRTKTGLYRERITVNGKTKVLSARNKVDLMLKVAQHKEVTPTFGETAEMWRESKDVSPGTWRCYNAPFNQIMEYFGEKQLNEITPKDVQRYLNQLSMSYKSTLTRKGLISQIYDYAIVDLDMDIKNPCERVKVDTRLPRSTRSALTDEELAEIRKTTKDEFILAPLILYTGMRCGEALALQFKDINYKDKTITISKSIYHQGNQPHLTTTKTKAGNRVVPLLPQLEALLPKGKATHFCIGGEEPITKSALAKRWEKWERTHGVHFDRHTIRHTYASILYESGIDVKSAQKLLGHANFQTTMDVYTHLSDQHLKESAQKLIDFMQ